MRIVGGHVTSICGGQEHLGPSMPSQGVSSGWSLQGGPLKASEERSDLIMAHPAFPGPVSLPQKLPLSYTDDSIDSIPKRWRKPLLSLWSTLSVGAWNLDFVQMSLKGFNAKDSTRHETLTREPR